MSFPSAYSLELRDTLTAEKAATYSRLPKNDKNHLEDYKQFQCSEFCSFKLSLTNFGEKNYTKTPYFTPGARNQTHDPDNCQLIIKHYHQREQEVASVDHGSFRREKNKLIIDLDLVKGVLATVTKSRQKDETISSSEPTRTDVKQRNPHSTSTVDNKTFRSHVKQLSDLIHYFLEYQSGEKYTFYSKDNRAIQLESYFVKLEESGQRGINLEDVHIYYDTASVISKTFKSNPENDYFLIIFNSECTLNGTSSHPTITINKRLANHHGVKGKLKTLEKAAKDKQPLKLFYFGKFRKHSSNKYINPDVGYEEILDYLVIS